MPIPPNAKSVFKGTLFEVFQWEQKMFDGSTEIFESVTRPNVVEVLAVVGDKIVVLEQSQPQLAEPFLSFPGGRIDPGEEALAAAKRELLEETGLASSDWHLYREGIDEGKVVMTRSIYIARECKKTSEPHLDPGERIASALWSFEEVLDLCNNPRFRHSSLMNDLVRARYNEEAKEQFRKTIFG